MTNDNGDQLRNRMLIGQMMKEQWEADPPDIDGLRTALDGCATLYQLAAGHLAKDPPDWREALACIKPALEGGHEVHGQVAMSYAFSGQATDDFLDKVRRSIADSEGEADG